MKKSQGRRIWRPRPLSASAPLPPDFARAAETWLGDEAPDFLAACVRPPRLAARANALKGGLSALRAILGDAAREWPTLPWWPEALLPPREDAARLAAGPLARVGALYAQDPTALAAVALLDPCPGERVLDLCAAPGGKSTAIADRLGASGLLVANDVDAARARELARTLERWGVRNGAVLSLMPDRLATLAPGFFDCVLVDAPCSGEAMFARHDRAAADWSPEHVRGCAARQRGLLDAARLLVRPSGRIVYSTCTFNPIENEGVIAAYLAAYPGDRLADATGPLRGAAPGRPDLLPDDAPAPHAVKAQLTRCARLWPHRATGAGHFVALLHVSGHTTDTPRLRETGAARSRRSRDDAVDTTAVDELLAIYAPALAHDRTQDIIVRGDRAFLVPDGLPAALAAAALSPGLQVAERPGRTWRPTHALAMTLHAGDTPSACALGDAAMSLFLAGRPVSGTTRDDGMALVHWHGYPLGWGRARRGIVTPLLPKGLRTPL